MNENNVMTSDIVREWKNGEFRYGAVIENYSEGEEESTLGPGCVTVEWYPDGLDVDIHQKEVEILDRALMPRDIVYKNHDELGTVLDTHKKGDFVIVGTEKKLTKIDSNKLEPITRFIGGETVAYGPWIGQVTEVHRTVHMKSTTSGSRGYIPEALLADILNMVEDPYPHKSDKGGYEGLPQGSSIFYPGQTLIMPPRACKLIIWSKNESEMLNTKTKVKLCVQWVTIKKVRVRWFQTSAFNYSNEKSAEFAAELGLSQGQSPPASIKNQQLKWLKTVNSFRNCFYSLGHRLMYRLTEDDAHELNKALKKRKRKHKPSRKSLRNESLERKQRRKLAGNPNSGIKRRHSQRHPITHKSLHDDDTTSDEDESFKECIMEAVQASKAAKTTHQTPKVEVAAQSNQNEELPKMRSSKAEALKFIQNVKSRYEEKKRDEAAASAKVNNETSEKGSSNHGEKMDCNKDDEEKKCEPEFEVKKENAFNDETKDNTNDETKDNTGDETKDNTGDETKKNNSNDVTNKTDKNKNKSSKGDDSEWSDDTEDEEQTRIPKKCWQEESKNLNVFGIKLSERKHVVRVDMKNYVKHECELELKGILEEHLNKFSQSVSQVKEYFKSAPASLSFVLVLEKSRKRMFYSKSSGTYSYSRYHLTDETIEENVPELSQNVAVQAGNKLQYFSGQQVTVETAMTYTSAKIQWQNGEIDEEIPSIQLTPTETLNDNDLFPGDFVVDMRQSGKSDLFRHGVVQKVHYKRKMALVKWFTFVNSLHTTLGEAEEMSIYDLQPNADYKYRVSDIVYLLSDVTEGNFTPSQCIGQILRVTMEGKLKIRWTDDSTTEVFPHEVMLFNEEEMGHLSDVSSMAGSSGEDDMSWTTISSDEETVAAEEGETGAGGEGDAGPDVEGALFNEDEWEDIEDDEEDASNLARIMNEVGHELGVSNAEILLEYPDAELHELPESGDNDAGDNEDVGDNEDADDNEDAAAAGDNEDDEMDKPSSVMEQFEVQSAAPSSHKFYKNATGRMTKRFIAANRRDVKLFAKSLPKGVYVRGYEDRMDLMSAMIVGPDNTPFRDGLFVFEIYFPPQYPEVPPKVHFVSMGPRLNPNLYENGTVCVSLLGTWSGQGNENWTKESSILQVLLSIQGLILNKEPYFNEAGYENQRNSLAGLNRSRWYNEMVVLHMIQHVTKFVNSPPLPFDYKTCTSAKSLIQEFVPRFIERNRALIQASKEAGDDFEKDLAPLAGFPLLCLSQGVIINIEQKLNVLEESARNHQLL